MKVDGLQEYHLADVPFSTSFEETLEESNEYNNYPPFSMSDGRGCAFKTLDDKVDI
jgi:hypothetical protein